MLPDDFRDALIELLRAGADAVVVGGYAVAFHGHPRATKDLDILVRPDPTNAARVHAALLSFGAPLTAIGLRNKRAAGRPQDLADVVALERLARHAT